MKDIRQTQDYANYLSSMGWKVETIGGVNYFIRKLPVIGSFIKVQRPEKLDLKILNLLAKKHGAFQLLVEPKDSKQESKISNDFKKMRSSFLPSLTLALDLTNSNKKLFAAVKKDARAAIKKNRGLTIKNWGENISTFRSIWRKAVGIKRYVPPLSDLKALKMAFGENALFLNKEDSGAIFLKADKNVYYWQAFTGKKGRNEKIQYKIVWGGILWAKKMGAKVFDFEGIYDERFPNESWQGFTHFKKSFGGYRVFYPGAFVKNLLPFNLWILKKK